MSEYRDAAVADAAHQMQMALSECVLELLSIIRDSETQPQVKINAIQLLMNQCKNWTEVVDILRRLDELEQRNIE